MMKNTYFVAILQNPSSEEITLISGDAMAALAKYLEEESLSILQIASNFTQAEAAQKIIDLGNILAKSSEIELREESLQAVGLH